MWANSYKTASLNKHLSGYMPGLTAKVFRTYNASWTMANLLRDMKPKGTANEKVKDYNDANREVAILCNHKRTVAAKHGEQMEKMGDRIKGLRYQKWRVKQMMIDVDPKIKKERGAAYFEREDDVDQEWVVEHQRYLVEELRSKIEKKFAKENEKLVAEGQKEMKEKELEERLLPAEELAATFKKENKTGKVEAEGKGPTIEKLENNIVKLEQRIQNMLLQAEDKESNKEVALGTSKIVSNRESGSRPIADYCRIISILVSPWCFPRNSTYRSRSSSRGRFGKSLTGPSSRWTRIGSFSCACFYSGDFSDDIPLLTTFCGVLGRIAAWEAGCRKH